MSVLQASQKYKIPRRTLHSKVKKMGIIIVPPKVSKNSVPKQRLKPKRYLQYTKKDFMAAIEEVKNGMYILP